MDDIARDIFLRGDETPIYYSSLALMTFQRAFGLFPRILGKGDAAKVTHSVARRGNEVADGPNRNWRVCCRDIIRLDSPSSAISSRRSTWTD